MDAAAAVTAFEVADVCPDHLPVSGPLPNGDGYKTALHVLMFFLLLLFHPL